MESAAVDSFIDGIHGWNIQSLVRMHSYKNTTDRLSFALEVKAERRASCRPIAVQQLKGECTKEPKSSFSKEMKTRTAIYCTTKRQVTRSKKFVAQEIFISQLNVAPRSSVP